MSRTSTPFLDISSAIADYPRLELVLALAIIGWIAMHWLTRTPKKEDE